MTEQKQLFCWCSYVLAAGLFVSAGYARADGGTVRDDSNTLSLTSSTASKSWWQERFAGSSMEINNYFGSGSFYTSGYSDPYVATAFYVRPTIKLGTKRELTVWGRGYLEYEYTKPDNPNGRRYNPLDTWLGLSARNLYTEAHSKIRLAGLVRAILPTSFESRFQHMVVGLSAGLSVNRLFQFGTPDPAGKKWELAVSLGSAFTKFIQTSKYRGAFAGDSTGCLASNLNTSGGLVGAGSEGSAASSTDHCGGPLNTNFGFTSSLGAALIRRRVSLGVTMIVINQFAYAVPEDQFAATATINRGRSDFTWGLISLGYDITDHLGVSLGLSSYQPALDSTYNHPRFPFFDFSGPNANNFTQAFVGVSGTI
ncbi:MAG TPA: hypothetical protein VH374_10905 [Polyangia bacterium]|nr:hypothetical protein [Polyangia bacterium]